MANRYSDPDVQFSDSTGAALAGAKLFFYATGTSTKQNTYSDSALSIANTNPVIADANGRVGSIFLQNSKYKVVLAPSTDTDPPTSPIWTQDPVYTSDVSTIAQVQGTNGNPNGQLAGTAGSAGIPASMDWDFTNDVLYVCTTTGSSSTAVWVAVNPAASSMAMPVPQGRLTMITAAPVISTDVIAGTTVFYTPTVGVYVPIFNGSIFVATSIVSELSAALVNAHAANKIYDWYIFNLNGVATLGSGPSWDVGGGSVTAGSCARGTGAGSAQLARISGILVNAVSMTMTYASGLTTTVPANQATLVGSMLMDGNAGQLTCNVSYGQVRKFGLWNLYNRHPIILLMGDPTASWTYNSATIRQSNGSTSNFLQIFTGAAEEATDIQFFQRVTAANGVGQTAGPTNALGLNSSVTASGTSGFLSNVNASTTIGGNLVASYQLAAVGGLNNIVALESGNAGGGTHTWFGTQANMLVRATWNG